MGYEPIVECRDCHVPLDVYQDYGHRFCECCAETREQTAAILDQWEGGEIGLVEAFECLTDIDLDPVDAADLLQKRSPQEYEKQDATYQAEMAGAI
jgi:hypothetical protein